MSQARLTLTAKNQVTLRKEFVDHLGVVPGGKIDVETLPNGELRVRAAPKGDISRIFGMLKRPGQPVLTIEEIKRATEAAWAGKR